MFRKCFRSQKFFKIYITVFILFLLLYFKQNILAYFGLNNWLDDASLNKLSIYEKEIRDYESRIIVGLGNEGRASYLDDTDKEYGQLSLKFLAVNTILSDRIPLDRTLKDYRNPKCKQLSYDVSKNASVIIIFFNEPFSVLLRTVWSIINRTPHNLLHEIILVDDCSDVETLGKRLDLYIATRLANHPVKLIRSPKRLGLIRARLMGARAATGQILVFLDAHCETTVQWLEPLIARIEADHTTVVMPIIDVIEADTFYYSTNGNLFQIGGFSWNGHFTWIDIQKNEKYSENSVEPVRSPTMAGGLFAMDRIYFWEVGSYDEQMDGWGGENLEMSFRVWQCGGKLEVVPCSRVGHVFREFHPYKFPHNKDTHGINTARMALVWMDKYADLLFLHKENYRNNPIVGDLTHRKQLRNKLRCKPFSWYLKNVYPEKFIPTENVKNYGRLKSGVDNMCADNMQLADDKIGPLGLYSCHQRLTPSQFFSFSLSGEIRQEENCAEATNKNIVQLAKCHGHGGNQEWFFKRNKLVNKQNGLCLSSEGVLINQALILQDCNKKSPYQNWSFSKGST